MSGKIPKEREHYSMYQDLFDFKIALKTLRIFTMIAVLYQLLQVVSYNTFGLVLPRGIYSFLTYDTYGEANFNQIDPSFYRASSFFIEPAAFVQYVLLYLVILLFKSGKKDKHENVEILLISASIILSGSGQGLILLGVSFTLWYLSRTTLAKKISMLRIICALAVPVALYFVARFVFSLEVVQNNLERIVGDNGIISGYATQARMVGYRYLNELKGIFWLIGKGYGNVPRNIYFPSVAYTIYSSGAVGIGMVALLMLWLFFRCKSYGRAFTVIYCILIAGTTAFFGCNICFYLPFVLADATSGNNIPYIPLGTEEPHACD